ncbi:MAG: sodium:alanine symporter family protein [Clostridia bacterium]|nr:sodium:alanine symporter family protein [Clostridia bacterium]
MLFFEKLTGFLWGTFALPLFFACGALLTFKTRAFQVRRFICMLKSPFYREGKGGKSGFRAACVAIGGSVGAANISGVATAVATGGPGALFWMLAAAFFGMIIKTAEVTLAVRYRVRRDGKAWGGPTYYMQRFFGEEKGIGFWKAPAVIFGCGIFAGVFLNVQNYAVSEAVASAFKIPVMLPSLLLCAAVYAVTAGGVSSVGRASAFIVPFMCVFYVGCVGVVLYKNASDILPSLSLILNSAFGFRAAAGGCAGAALKVGLSRAVYSNEAGWGTSPMAHAASDINEPARQGLLGAFEVFVDTFIVCLSTGLLVVCTGAYKSGLAGAALALYAIEGALGPAASVFVAVSVFLFGLSSGGTWYTYYETLAYHAFPDKKTRDMVLKLVLAISPLSGVVITYLVDKSGGGARLLWALADFSAFLPAFINLSALIFMRDKFCALISDFERKISKVS